MHLMSSSRHSDFSFSRPEWLPLTCSKPLPPLLLHCGSPWAPHQGLPYWSPGITSSHNMAPYILSQLLERFFTVRKNVGCVWQSTGTRRHTGALLDSTRAVFSLLLHKELLESYFSGKLLILSVQLNQLSALQTARKLSMYLISM